MITCAERRPDLEVSIPLAEAVELGQGRRVDDDARSDDRGDVRVEHARGNEVELEHLVAEHDRVARVVAALVAHDHRHLLGQEVGRLALALIAPLEPDDHRGRHVSGPPGQTKRPRPTGSGPGYTPPLGRRRCDDGRSRGCRSGSRDGSDDPLEQRLPSQGWRANPRCSRTGRV
jgi:hypothetical protein